MFNIVAETCSIYANYYSDVTSSNGKYCIIIFAPICNMPLYVTSRYHPRSIILFLLYSLNFLLKMLHILLASFQMFLELADFFVYFSASICNIFLKFSSLSPYKRDVYICFKNVKCYSLFTQSYLLQKNC